MNRTRRLMANLTVLNVLLAVLLLGGALWAAWPFFGPAEQMTAAAVTEPAPPSVEPAAASGRSPMDYAAVTDQNLFHPERKYFPGQTAKEPARPDLVLYGTLITGETSIAYVEDRKSPHSTPGRGKRQIAVKKGGRVSGYTVQEIEPNRIVLSRGDDRIVVPLDSKDSRSTGTASAQQAQGMPAPVAPSPRPSIMPSAGGASAAPGPPGAAQVGQQPAPPGVQKKPVLLPGQLRRKIY